MSDNKTTSKDIEIEENLETENDDKQITELKNEVEDLKDQLLRAKAVADSQNYGISNFAKSLITVADYMDMALLHSKQEKLEEKDITNMVQGFEMTSKELESVFNQHGITSIGTKAKDDFDYNLHSAISTESNEKFENNQIISVVQKGYKIKDRLIRPTAVIICKK